MYTVIEDGVKVYIGQDLPNEYTHSKYTQYLQGHNRAGLRAKGKAASDLGLLIETATNRRWEKTKHPQNKDAKYGFYRYDSTFAFPIKDASGKITDIRAYDVELVIRNASDGKKYLYDIVGINEDVATKHNLQQREVRSATYSAATRSNVSNISINDPDGNVNGKSSRKRNVDARDRVRELERENERQRNTIEYQTKLAVDIPREFCYSINHLSAISKTSG